MKENGILFGGIHSYRDLNMILSDVVIPPAKPKTNFVDIPGGDEPLDITEENGEVKFECRECEFYFVVNTNETKSFEEKKMEVCNALNGKREKIVLDSDSNYYYEGRILVNSYKQKKFLKKIRIDAIVFPYKLKTDVTTVAVAVNGTAEIICPNDRKSVVPTIISDAEMTLSFGNFETTISEGEHIVPDIKFVEGDNVITCTGNGTITFVYQEGAL